jgi:hypothetical protein
MASIATGAPLKLTGFGQVVEKLGDRVDFIGFLRHAELRQDQSGIALVGHLAYGGL